MLQSVESQPNSRGQAESSKLIKKRNNQGGLNQILLGSPAWLRSGQESSWSRANNAAFVSFPQAVGRAGISWGFSAPSGPLRGL